MARKRLEEPKEGLDRTTLVNALKIVLPGVEKKNTMSGLDTVFFDTDWIRTFNLEISISYPIQTGIQCAIRMEELFKVLSRMEGDRVTLKISSENGKNKAVFKDKKTTLKMAMREDVSFEEQMSSLKIPDLGDSKAWKKIPADFVEGTALCLWSAAVDRISGATAGVFFSNEIIYATDNERISQYIMESSFGTSFILPTNNVYNLLRIGEPILKFSENKSWVHFLFTSGGVMSIRKLPGDYPKKEIEEYFKACMDQKGDFYELPEGLKSSIDRAWAISDILTEDIGRMVFIFLQREGDHLVVRGKKDAGEVIDHIPWDSELPEDVVIMINPKFLLRIIDQTRSFKIKDNKGAIYFETEKFKHVIAAKIQ